MLPVIPHYASECLDLLGFGDIKNSKWPEIDNDNLIEEKIKYVVQINGKTRQIIEEKNSLSKEDLINLVMNSKNLKKYFENNNEIKRVVFVPKKLINLILNVN